MHNNQFTLINKITDDKYSVKNFIILALLTQSLLLHTFEYKLLHRSIFLVTIYLVNE